MWHKSNIAFRAILFGALSSLSCALAHTTASDFETISLDSLLNIPVSTAVKHAQNAADAPASVSVITSEDIARFGWKTLDEVLVSVKGFYQSNDRNYSYIGTRGFSRPTDYNNRILLLINGHTVNEQVYGSAPLGSTFGLDLSIIDRIEIVSGPGSTLYGTGAMFSVINIITKSSSELSGIQTNLMAGSEQYKKAGLSYGARWSNGLEMVLSGQVADTEGDDLYLPEYDDPETNNGIVEDLDWSRSYGFLAHLKWRNLVFQSYLTSRIKGIPTAAYGITFNDKDAQTEDTWFGAELLYEIPLKQAVKLFCRGYYDSYYYGGDYPYDPDPVWQEFSKEKRVGAETRLLWDLESYNRLTVGLEYTNHFRIDNKYWEEDVTYLSDNTPFSFVSAFIQDEHQFTRNLTMTAGLRHSRYSQEFEATVPRAALVYRPFRTTTLKLLYGEAFRAPNYYEFYYVSDVNKGNPDLEPERIRTEELILEQRLFRRMFGTVSLYQYDITDLIDPVIDPEDELQQFRNAGGITAYGMEFELSHRSPGGLYGSASYGYHLAEGKDTDSTLTNSPRHILKIKLSHPVTRYFHAALESYSESSRYTLLRTKTDSYTLVHAALSTHKLIGTLQASLRVNNIFDYDYGLPGGYEHLEPQSPVDMPVIPQRGRNFTVRLDYKF